MSGNIADMTALQVLFAPGEQFTGRLLKGRNAAAQAIRLRLLTTLFYNPFWGFLIDLYVNARVDEEGNFLGALYSEGLASAAENEIEKEDFVLAAVVQPEWDPIESALTLNITVQLVGDDVPLQVVQRFGGL